MHFKLQITAIARGLIVITCLAAFPQARAADLAPMPEVTAASLETSIRRGVDFLVGKQNPNGSWGSATRTKALNIYSPLPGGHHAFRAGASGLALSGLIDARDSRPEIAASVAKAAAWTAAEMPKLRRADQTTTYNIWGHAYGLRAITRLHRLETDPSKKSEWVRLGQQQIDLADRYEDVNGGWGYLDVFDGLTTDKPSGTPTSFTTATLLLAMAEARDAMGVKLDEKIIKRSLISINYQRTPDFAYTYSFSHRMRPRLDINRPVGSLGRSQVCNSCLRVFGEKDVTDQVLTTWADRFLDHEGFLSNGRKRPVPHEAPFRIAGYFYYYGIYYFTESVRLMPKELQAAYAKRIAAILIAHQEKDGSWWDYPLYDYHQSYGTGYALMALAWCRETIAANP